MTAEFTDRWRAPGEAFAQLWEERFGEHVYVPLAEQAVTAALKDSGHRRRRHRPRHRHRPARPGREGRRQGASARGPRRSSTTSPPRSATPAPPTGRCCWPTSSTAPSPASRSPSSLLADGCDVWLLRTTDALLGYRPAATVRDRIAATRDDLAVRPVPDVARLPRSASRRAAPSRIARPRRRRPAPTPGSTPSSAAATRTASSTCRRRGSAWASGEIDQMEPVRMADVPATIATFTVDRLAFSLSPPVVAAVIDFDGGGRFQCELTDVDPATVAIGDRVGDDVPSPLHERRRAQLLLEGAAAGGRATRCRARRPDMASHGIRDRSPSSAWAARRSASTGTGRPTTC